MKIYLLGYMGCGKSTVGKNLAAALGLPWIDLDTEIETRYKISVPAFFAKYGETAFRDIEHQVLTDISALPEGVVSTGGGVPCFYDNMDLMNRTGLTIYLEATPELILSRIGEHASKRPVFQQMNGGDILQKVSNHLATREKYYRQAQLTVDAASPDIDTIKKLVLDFNHVPGGA